MKVIVEAINAPSLWLEPGTTAVLRAEAIKGFTTSDGQFVPPSNGNKLYLEIPISITGSVPLIESFEIDSTEDCMPWDSATLGDVPGYRFTIVTSRGKKIPYFQQCKIPVLTGDDTSFTWNELRIHNRNFHRRFTQLDRLINEDQVLTWIQDALGARGLASETNLGLISLLDDPVDPTFPIALGPNSPQVAGGFVLYASKYDSLNLAHAAMLVLGGGTVVVDAPMTVTTDLVMDAGVALRFEGQGILTGTATVTITGLLSAEPKQIFGSGITVLFTGNTSTRTGYLEWWGGGVGVAAATNDSAFTAAITALVTLGGGGTLQLQPGVYEKSTAVNPGVLGITIQGAGWSTLVGAVFGDVQWVAAGAIKGTVIQNTGTSADGILINGTNQRNFHLKDLAILGPGGGSTVGVNFNGSTASARNMLSNVLIANFSIGLRFQNFLDGSFYRLFLHGNTVGLKVTSTSTTNVRFFDSDVQYSTTGIQFLGGNLFKFYGLLVQNNTTGISLAPDSGNGLANIIFDGVWSESNTTGVDVNSTTGAISAITFRDCRESTGYTLSPTIVSAINRVTLENCEWSGVTLTLGAGTNDWVLMRSNIAALNQSGDRMSRINSVIAGQTGSTLGSAAFALTYAATVTPDYNNGEVQEITLTGNVTINVPTNPNPESTITYIIRQDGTGGRTVTFGAGYHHGWSDTGNTASKYSSISFRYIGSGQWVQIGAQSPYFS